MMTSKRAHRDVLRDQSGLSTSIMETLGGISLKMLTVAMIGGVLVTLLVFWGVATASADTSSGFQTANLGFEKAVSESDVVIGITTNKVGLLKDVAGNKCEVSTWQMGTRDGGKSLNVDRKTLAGVCNPLTVLSAVGTGELSQELLFGIEAPVFTYENLGGRAITFTAAGASILATGTKPAAVTAADWADVRPYKVTLKLETLNADTSSVTKKAVLSAFTNVMNVTAAADDLRYVPSPDTDPIPGPLHITGVERSSTTGTVYAGAHEGVAVTFAGGVCPAGSTKINMSYSQQGPAAKAAVSTVYTGVLTGSATTVHLGSVANGSSGAVDMDATCTGGTVAEKANTGYTQLVPPTVLTVRQNAAAEKHDLSWVAVSSLASSYELRWTVGPTDKGVLATTSALLYQSVNTVGANYGYTSTYSIVATIDSNKSPVETASITNSVPGPGTTTLTSSATGATWTAAVCSAGSTPQYAPQYYQQTGTNTGVSVKGSSWSTSRTLSGVTTPAYGRTITKTQTSCIATNSKVISASGYSNEDSFYTPEAINVAASRSSTTGTAYMGAREGMTAWHSGARCWNGTSSTITLSWQPEMPSGQGDVNNTRTIVPTGSGQSVELNGVRNGAQGSLVGSVKCTAGDSNSSTDSLAFNQGLPNPGLDVTQTSPNVHKLVWGQVSSLSTTFSVEWASSNGAISGVAGSTTGLSFTATQATGSTYGHTSYYTVRPKVGNYVTASSDSTYTSWPAVAAASSLNSSISNVSNRTLTWANGAGCPSGTTKQTRYTVNKLWDWNGNQVAKDFETSPYANNKYQDSSWLAIDQGYPFQFEVDTTCVSAYSTSPVATTQSGNQWNIWNTPAAPVWNALTTWVKTEQPAGSIYDICRNKGTRTCSFVAYGDSIELKYNVSCPGGSKMDASTVDSLAWNNARFYPAINEQDGWETGRVDQPVSYSNARYNCKTPWNNVSPTSTFSGTKNITVLGR